MKEDQTRIEGRRVRIAEHIYVCVERLRRHLFFAVWPVVVLSSQKSVVSVWQYLANSNISKQIIFCAKNR
jgi:hypothetical protein